MKAFISVLVAAVSFSLILINLVSAEEYIAGENLTIGITNATNGSIITTADCNITISNSSGVLIDAVFMDNAGDGSYNWTIDGIDTSLTEKYLAKANCTVAGNEWTTWAHFSVVDVYSYDKIDDIPSAAEVWDTSPRNLTFTNATENMNLTQSAFDTIQTHVWAATTRTLSSFGTLVADIWAYAARTLTNWAEIPELVWNHTYRNNTWVSITNVTQQEQLENVTGGAVTNIYDNSTLNVILPAEAI